MRFTQILAEAEKIAGFKKLSSLQKPWIHGYMEASGRQIPVLETALSIADHLGSLKVRCNLGRSRYMVLPGLYAAGRPGPGSPVLVTANYKLSLDCLRRELADIAAWILVLDTRGINVWSAAGKGSFSTKELARTIRSTKLTGLVEHRRLVLPQLGAVGVSAPELARLTGFQVSWGPVRAADLPTFLDRGMKKDGAMSRIDFGLIDRIKLIPLELVQAWPLAAVALILAGILAFATGTDGLKKFAEWTGVLLGIWFTGTAAFPVLLPFLPGLAFAVKGAVLGLAWGITASVLTGADPVLGLALGLVSASVVSFLAMNFTGATTFTSQTGALLEVEKGIIPQISALATGLAIGVFAVLTGRGGLA